MGYITTQIATLVPTILIELGVLWLLLERRWKVLLSSVVVNVLTNVPLCYFLLTMNGSWLSVLVGELLVVAVETAWYRWFTGQWRQAFFYSVLCNAISFLLGLLFQLVCIYLDIIY